MRMGQKEKREEKRKKEKKMREKGRKYGNISKKEGKYTHLFSLFLISHDCQKCQNKGKNFKNCQRGGDINL